MQVSMDLAQRNYLLRSELIKRPIEENKDILKPKVEITLLDKGTAFLAGAAIASIVNNLKQTSSQFFLTALGKITALPSETQSKELSHKMLEDMNLKKNGVKVLFVEDNVDDINKVSEIIQKNNSKFLNKVFNNRIPGVIKKIIKFFASTQATLIAKSKKASFFVNENIAITSKNTSQMIFHELGHAKVACNKHLKYLLTVGKKLPIVVTGVGFLTLTHSPNKDISDKPKNKWNKTKDFVDANIGKLTLLSFAPILTEKFVASYESLKIAKKYLKGPQLKSLRKLYGIGLLTYGTTAFAAYASIGLGNKIQNNIIKQKNSPQDVYNLLI